MYETVYLNGKQVEKGKALISALDYGFLYGFGLFDTMRAYAGKVFRISQHLRRLQDAARVLDLTVDSTGLRNAVIETINANKLDSARVRITISPGLGEISPNLDTCISNTTLVMAERYIAYPERVYRNGFQVITSTLKRSSKSKLSALKSTSYLTNILAKKEAEAKGVDEAICLNEKGLLTEASMSNIFLIDNNMLKTPTLQSGILPGITRQAVIELAIKMGIECKEEDITADELYQSREAFLTNSLIEIMPLTRVDDKQIGSGKMGKMTKSFLAEYRKLVSRELGGKIKERQI